MTPASKARRDVRHALQNEARAKQEKPVLADREFDLSSRTPKLSWQNGKTHPRHTTENRSRYTPENNTAPRPEMVKETPSEPAPAE